MGSGRKARGGGSKQNLDNLLLHDLNVVGYLQVSYWNVSDQSSKEAEKISCYIYSCILLEKD